MTSTDYEKDVSVGRNADAIGQIEKVFGSDLCDRFEIFSYRNAASVLLSNFKPQYEFIIKFLNEFSITETMIRTPGGNKGPIVKYIEDYFPSGWQETQISADLHVSLNSTGRKRTQLNSYIKRGYLDGHKIDFVNGRLAVDVEWNSKDQTYDRDLYAFSAFYQAGAIDLGLIITRGSSINTDYLRKLGKVLKKNGEEGSEPVYKKFGASTTWMGKLLYRLDAGRNGGCPVLAVGITPNCIRPE